MSNCKRFHYYGFITGLVDAVTLRVDIDLGFGIWLRDRNIRIINTVVPDRDSTNTLESVVGKRIYETSKKYVLNKECKILSCSLDSFGRIIGDVFIDMRPEKSYYLWMLKNNYGKKFKPGVTWSDEELNAILQR